MTKKTIALISGIISVVVILSDFVGTYVLCGYLIKDGHEGSCPFFLSSLEMILFPIIPLFIFSLITFKMREEIFQAWWKFARIWTVVSMLAILISPSNSHNWILPIEKGTVSFFSSALFVVISFGLIGWGMRKGK